MNSKKDKIPIVLLVGYGHSGSTLLDLIMDSHSNVMGVGELFQLKNVINNDGVCTCGKPVSECYFWRSVLENIRIGKMKIGQYFLGFLYNSDKFLGFDKNGRSFVFDLDKWLYNQKEIYERILDVSQTDLIFDSSKSPTRASVFLKSNDFDVTLLHLVRDGRASVYSYMKVHEGWNSLYFMWQWFFINIKIEILKLRNKNIKSIFVRYEDLVDNPEEEIKRICGEMNINFESGMLNFQDKIHHQVSGNLKLRKRVKEQVIKKDERWRKNMSFYNKFMFNILFGWLNLFYLWRRGF